MFGGQRYLEEYYPVDRPDEHRHVANVWPYKIKHSTKMSKTRTDT
jgi:hypothetical protein